MMCICNAIFFLPDMWIYILKIFVTCRLALQSSENGSALVWLFFIFLFIRPDMWIYILKIFVTCWSPIQGSVRVVVPSFQFCDIKMFSKSSQAARHFIFNIYIHTSYSTKLNYTEQQIYFINFFVANKDVDLKLFFTVQMLLMLALAILWYSIFNLPSFLYILYCC